MYTFILQDWTTIQGQNALQVVTQADTGWLDLGPYQDVVFWVDIREVSLTPPTLNIQTSPTEDEAFFQNLVASIAMGAGQTPTVYPAFMTNAPVPLARFVRWQLVGGVSGPWNATFRIVAAANAPGA